MKHDLNYYKHPQQNFTKEMVNDTLKYQKKYGFEIGENNLAVDNESDAFRHTYMQAYLSLNFGNSIAKFLGSMKNQDFKQMVNIHNHLIWIYGIINKVEKLQMKFVESI